MRLELSRKTHLALLALRVLERSEAQMKGVDVATSIGTTVQFLPQIMAPLVGSGWVASEPGPRGGYRLTQGLGTLYLLEVIEAVEGQTDEGRCVLRDAPCSSVDECALHEPWQQARAALLSELARTSVAEHPVEAA